MKNELDESYCLFGAKALLERLNALTQEIDGVRKAEDIEHLHRMRVASRRVRSTLALFEECFPQKMVKNWRKQMRRVTRTLGDARDADVQIDFLDKFLDSPRRHPETGLEEARYHAGIKRLLLRLRQKREGLQGKVIKAVDRLEANGVLENRKPLASVRLPNIEETLRQIRIHGRLNKVDIP